MTLTFERVTRRFGRHVVLRDLDLHLDAGERVVLLGPNGAGKTTLLRLAAGLLRPTNGTVHRQGVATTHASARRGLAYVGQDVPVYAELTVREHLHWWARMHGKTADEAWLDHAGLRRVAEERAGALSRGQRQRLHLAMAFAIDADLLLLDEPTSALDEAGRAWLLESLVASPAAMLIATHDHDLAATLRARTVQVGA